MLWLHALGLISEGEGDAGFASVAAALASGNLLCEVAAAVGGVALAGVAGRPLTAAARQGNVTRALAALRSLPGIHTK